MNFICLAYNKWQVIRQAPSPLRVFIITLHHCNLNGLKIQRWIISGGRVTDLFVTMHACQFISPVCHNDSIIMSLCRINFTPCLNQNSLINYNLLIGFLLHYGNSLTNVYSLILLLNYSYLISFAYFMNESLWIT